MSDRWPAHIAERAAIFELIGQDFEPIQGPTRLPLLIEADQYVEFDPRTFRVFSVGRVCVEPQQNGDNQS